MEDRIRLAMQDEEAMVRLLEEIEPFVYRLSFHLTQHQQDAEDVAQETLYKVCTKLSTYRGESSFQTWVYSFVMNTFKDLIRKRKVVQEPLLDKQSIESFEDVSDAKLTVTALLSQLPEVDRQVMILRFCGGLSVREVSKAMNLSEANVKTKVFRIKQRLQGFFPIGGEAL